MADVYDIRNSSAPRVQPITLIDPGEWQGKPVRDREWLIPGICIRGGATLLNGDGGVGKSLLCLQLQAALALGQPWLGLETPAKATRSLGIYCEDEPDELHRRMADITRYYKCNFSHLAGNAMMVSRVGENNTMMKFDRRSGAGEPTAFFKQLDATINDLGIEVVIIDTAADTFSGSEIDREQVRSFVQKLRGWSLRTRGAVIITQHPSMSGMASGTGASGSTGWNNSVRSRVYLTKNDQKDEDGDDIPTNERLLKFMKSNYGPTKPKMRLVWEDGVFKPVTEASETTFVNIQIIKDAMMGAAIEYVNQGVRISPDPNSRTALVNRARKDREKLAVYSQSQLARVYKEMIDQGELVTTTFKNKKRETETYVRPSWLKYPDEGQGNP